MEKLEKKELGILVNVIKNKKQIENKTKELTFSTAKNKSRMKKKNRRKKDGSIYSMECRKRRNKMNKNSVENDKKFHSKISSRKKVKLPVEENAYNFIKINDTQNSNM